jgi:hypothetical protein
VRARTALVGPAFAGTRIVPPTLLVDDARDLDLGDRVLHPTTIAPAKAALPSRWSGWTWVLTT